MPDGDIHYELQVAENQLKELGCLNANALREQLRPVSRGLCDPIAALEELIRSDISTAPEVTVLNSRLRLRKGTEVAFVELPQSIREFIEHAE